MRSVCMLNMVPMIVQLTCSTTYSFVVICNQPDIPPVQHFVSIRILGACASGDRAYFQHTWSLRGPLLIGQRICLRLRPHGQYTCPRLSHAWRRCAAGPTNEALPLGMIFSMELSLRAKAGPLSCIGLEAVPSLAFHLPWLASPLYTLGLARAQT